MVGGSGILVPVGMKVRAKTQPNTQPSHQGAWERMEPNEAARGYSFYSRLNKRVWVHEESWAPPAESVRTVSFAHATANWCPHHMLFLPVRSGDSVLPNDKKQ